MAINDYNLHNYMHFCYVLSFFSPTSLPTTLCPRPSYPYNSPFYKTNSIELELFDFQENFKLSFNYLVVIMYSMLCLNFLEPGCKQKAPIKCFVCHPFACLSINIFS